MNSLQLRHLERLCDKHDIDYQEIDESLSYSENKQHLLSLVTDIKGDLDEWKSQREQYMAEHALTHYIMCILDGSTKSEETGPPWEHRFSLAQYMEANR